MPIEFYMLLFNLTNDARRKFTLLVKEAETLESTVSEYASLWHQKMRSHNFDPIMCRQHFRARCIVIGAQHGMRHGCGCRVAGAFALYLCDTIERRVYKLNLEDTQ